VSIPKRTSISCTNKRPLSTFGTFISKKRRYGRVSNRADEGVEGPYLVRSSFYNYEEPKFAQAEADQRLQIVGVSCRSKLYLIPGRDMELRGEGDPK
jgi:hypothetical protein